MKYQVRYNSHRYSDHSDRPRSCVRIVEASSPDLAADQLRLLRAQGTKVNGRYIGLVFGAEPLERVTRYK